MVVIGDVGPTGSIGPQGPPGPPGKKGQEGQGLSGVKYVRWGRTNCSGDAAVVYSGKRDICFTIAFNSIRELKCTNLNLKTPVWSLGKGCVTFY